MARALSPLTISRSLAPHKGRKRQWRRLHNSHKQFAGGANEVSLFRLCACGSDILENGRIPFIEPKSERRRLQQCHTLRERAMGKGTRRCGFTHTLRLHAHYKDQKPYRCVRGTRVYRTCHHGIDNTHHDAASTFMFMTRQRRNHVEHGQISVDINWVSAMHLSDARFIARVRGTFAADDAPVEWHCSVESHFLVHFDAHFMPAATNPRLRQAHRISSILIKPLNSLYDAVAMRKSWPVKQLNDWLLRAFISAGDGLMAVGLFAGDVGAPKLIQWKIEIRKVIKSFTSAAI